MAEEPAFFGLYLTTNQYSLPWLPPTSITVQHVFTTFTSTLFLVVSSILAMLEYMT